MAYVTGFVVNIVRYLGIPYDLHNADGFCNCWSLVALVYKDELKTELIDFKAQSLREIGASFALAFAEGRHGFTKAEKPKDFTVVIFKNKTRISENYHCGIMYKNKVLHASKYNCGSVYQSLKQASLGFKEIEYWQL